MQAGAMGTGTPLGDTEQVGTREEIGITEATGVIIQDSLQERLQDWL
ncbi:hypothetical protein DET59_10965 [Rossellomorea aquimaris]|uniref:Uncharacterized protein n=1 Tax=Rossellomorea aquimaris TaxID=189382 RepID=A0A366ELV8_9BACI|nr:hypothetical protein DET59_10965 [Rossellomorea aquimaris]